jgi:hypothetical protein
MARGSDSAGDPRRRLDPRIREGLSRQQIRREYLFGPEGINKTAERDLSSMSLEKQADAILRMADSTTGAVAKDLMAKDTFEQHHLQRGDAVPVGNAPTYGKMEPAYGMTPGEHRMREAGKSVPTGVPSSVDPFAFGAAAGYSEESESAAWKRPKKSSAEEDE